MTRSSQGRHRRRGTRRSQVVAVAPLIALTLGAGMANAAPSAQPGTTGGEGAAHQQPGTTTAPAQPVVVPPTKPNEQSGLGSLLPEPAQHDPSEYRLPPSQAGNGSRSGGNAVPAGNTAPSQPTAPSGSNPTLAEDLQGLHAPTVVEQSKIIVPPDPTKLGVGDATIAKPDWVPADVAWKINALAAEQQREVDTWLNSVGFSGDRSTRMGTGIVAGGLAGATCLGVPAAVGGAVVGALIGGTIGGIAGAAMGTLIPIPGIATITSGVAGTAIGAGVGAGVGAVVAGVPAALIGGGVGMVVGAVSTAGDGSDFTPPPSSGQPTEQAGGSQGPTTVDPSLRGRVRMSFDAAVAAATSTVDWIQQQPGGTAALDTAVGVGAATNGLVPPVPAADQLVRQVVATVEADPRTGELAKAVSDVLGDQQPFSAAQFGPLTGAVNNALTAAQAVLS